METVVFLLGKKDFLASRYHLFHHGTLPPLFWIASRYYPGYNTTLFILVNSISHILILGYFVFIALFPKWKKMTLWWRSAFNWIHVRILKICSPQKQDFFQLFFKIVQFSVILIHGFNLLFHTCDDVPPILVYTAILWGVSIFIVYSVSWF